MIEKGCANHLVASHRFDPQARELSLRSDSGAQENAGSGYCARGEHHLWRVDPFDEPSSLHFETDHLPLLKQNATDQRFRLNPQVVALTHFRRQVTARCAHPNFVDFVHRVRPTPWLRCSVGVGNRGESEPSRRGEKGALKRNELRWRVSSDWDWTRRPVVKRVGEVEVVLKPLECREALIPCPHRQSKRGPLVVVVRTAAKSDARVDRARASDDFPPRKHEQVLSRRRSMPKAPVVPSHRVLPAIAKVRRNLIRTWVVRPRFDQHDLAARVLGRASGDHRTRRTRTDDDQRSDHAFSASRHAPDAMIDAPARSPR